MNFTKIGHIIFVVIILQDFTALTLQLACLSSLIISTLWLQIIDFLNILLDHYKFLPNIAEKFRWNFFVITNVVWNFPRWRIKAHRGGSRWTPRCDSKIKRIEMMNVTRVPVISWLQSVISYCFNTWQDIALNSIPHINSCSMIGITYPVH